MPKKRLRHGHMAFALSQAKGVMTGGEICRKMEIVEPTFYRCIKEEQKSTRWIVFPTCGPGRDGRIGDPQAGANRRR